LVILLIDDEHDLIIEQIDNQEVLVQEVLKVIQIKVFLIKLLFLQIFKCFDMIDIREVHMYGDLVEVDEQVDEQVGHDVVLEFEIEVIEELII
jgi:hypothetical protein